MKENVINSGGGGGITPEEFARKIKAKYPQYKDVEDSVLVQKMIAKYPEYKNQINFPTPKGEVAEPSMESTSSSANGKSSLDSKPEVNPLDNFLKEQVHPEYKAERERLMKEMESRPIMADNSDIKKKLKDLDAKVSRSSTYGESLYSNTNKKVAEIDKKIFELEKKADGIAKRKGLAMMDILNSDGTYLGLKEQKTKYKDLIKEDEQVLQKVVEDTNADIGITSFIKNTARVFGYEEDANQTIELDSKVKEVILSKLDSDPRTKGKLARGYMSLKEKEDMINLAKSTVIKDEIKNLTLDAEEIKGDKNLDETQKEEKLLELQNKSQTLLASVGYDQASGMLKNNFKKTDQSEAYDKLVSQDGFFSSTADAAFTFTEGLLQTGAKGTVGFVADAMSGFLDISTDQDKYSSFDAFSDTVGQLTNFNLFSTSNEDNTRLVDVEGDLNLNYKTVTKSLAQTLPFTLLLINDVKKGNFKNVELSMGKILSPQKSEKVLNSLKMVDSAFRHTYSDNIAAGKDLGLDDNQARTYAGVMSTVEGTAELIMPDTKFLKTNIGKSLVQTFSKNLKSATNKQAVSQAVKTFTKNVALELGEEEVVALMEDVTKFAMVLGHENSEFLDITRQKELASATIAMSFVLGGANLNQDIKANKKAIYDKIIGDVNGVKDILQSQLDSKSITEQERADYTKSIKFVNRLTEAVNKAPKNVTSDQIDLLIEKGALIEKMKGLDDSFHPKIKEEIEIINQKINGAYETATTNAETGSQENITGTDIKGQTIEGSSESKPSEKRQIDVHKDTSGSTYSYSGENLIGKKGKTSVSIFPERSKIVEGEITQEDIDTYKEENKDIFEGNEDVLAVGTWYSEETGRTYLDVAGVVNSEHAESLGKEYDQEGVYDLSKTDGSGYIPTGGSGNVQTFDKTETDRINQLRGFNEQNKQETISEEQGISNQEGADSFSITDVEGSITENVGEDKIGRVNAAVSSFFSESNRKVAERNLRNIVNDLVKRGKLTQSQAKNLINRALTVDVLNEKQVGKFVDFFNKEIAKAETRDAKNVTRNLKKKAKASARTASKKTPQNLKDLAFGASAVDERFLTEKEAAEFSATLEEINNSFKPISNKDYKMVDVETATTKVEELYNKAERRKAEEMAQTMGLDATSLSNKEIQELYEAENVDEYIEKLQEAKAKEARTLLEKQAEYAQMGLEDYKGDNLSSKEKSALEAFKRADFSNMSSSMIRDYIKITDNIVLNDNFSNSSVIKAFLKAEKSTKEVIKNNNKKGINPRELNTARENLKILGIKVPNTFNFPDHIKHLINAMTSLNVTMNIIGGSSREGAFLYDKLGFFNLSNAKVKAEVRKAKFDEVFNKMLEKIAKSDPKVLEGSQVVRRSVIGTLLQADNGSIESMERFKNDYIKKSIETLKKFKRNHQQSQQKIEILENILTELDGINTKEELIEYLKTKDKSNYKILKFTSDLFIRHSKEFSENSYLVHGESFDPKEESDFYLPLMRSNLMEKSMTSKINDAREAMNFMSYRSENPKSGSIFTRKKNARLDKGQTINFNFDQAVSSKFGEQVFDMESSEAILEIKNILGHPDFIKEFGLGTAQELQKKAIDKIAMDSGSVFSSAKEWEKNFGNIEKILRKLGSINALGGIDQFFKQYPAVVFSAGIRLGSDASLLGKYMFTDKSNIGLLKSSSIRLRAESDAGVKRASDDVKYEDLSLADKNKVQVFSKLLTKYGGITLDKARELSMLSLRIGDVNAANTTFLSYYHSFLRGKGIADSDIDMDTEHIKIEEGDKVRREAQAYAQHMINTTQTSSDLTEGSNFVANPNVMTRLFMGAIMPFSSHSNNAVIRLLKTTKNLSLGKNKKENSMEIAASISEIAMFHSMKAFLIAPATIYLGQALFGSNDDDSEEMIDWAFQTVKAASGTFGDISPLPDSFDIDALNYLIYLQNREDYGEDLSFKEYNRLMKDISMGNNKKFNREDLPMSFYRYGDKDGFEPIAYDDFGLYNIPYEQAIKTREAIDLLYDGEMTKENKYGKNEQYIVDDEHKSFLMVYTLKEILATIGTGDATTRRMMEKRFRQILDESKVRKSGK